MVVVRVGSHCCWVCRAKEEGWKKNGGMYILVGMFASWRVDLCGIKRHEGKSLRVSWMFGYLDVCWIIEGARRVGKKNV